MGDWWVVAKFVLTTAAAVVLVKHLPAISEMARLAEVSAIAVDEHVALRTEIVAHAAGGLLVLAATVLSVSIAVTGTAPRATAPRWRPIVGVHALVLLLAFVVFHVVSGGMRH